MIRIRQAKEDDLDEIRDLDRELFRLDEPHDFEGDRIWVAVTRIDWPDGRVFDGPIIAYGAARESVYLPGCVYLSRAGVAPEWRGRDLQKRLIRARQRWAGDRPVYTYTLDNAASGNALIACGFRLFNPGLTVGEVGERWWRWVRPVR